MSRAGRRELRRLPRLLLEGRTNSSGAELAEKFEQLGTSVESGADWDSAFVKITVLLRQLEDATTQLLVRVISSRFSRSGKSNVSKPSGWRRFCSWRRSHGDWLTRNSRNFSIRRIPGTPGRMREAPRASALSPRGCREFLPLELPLGGTTVSLLEMSHLNRARAGRRALSEMAAGIGSKSQTTASDGERPERHIVDKPEAPQSELRVGHVGCREGTRISFRTLVMNAVLGGSSDRGSISISARCTDTPMARHRSTTGGVEPGPFVVSTAVESEVTAPALTEILLEIDESAATKSRMKSFRSRVTISREFFRFGTRQPRPLHRHWRRW
jgi:zinc protease